MVAHGPRGAPEALGGGAAAVAPAAIVVFFSWLLSVTRENLMRHLGLLPSESMEEAYLA